MHRHFVGYAMVCCRTTIISILTVVISIRRLLNPALHKSHTIGVLVEGARHKFMTWLRVCDNTVAHDNISIIIVPVLRIISAIIAVIRPRTRNVTIDEHDECSSQIDVCILRRRTLAGNPFASGAGVPKQTVPYVIIHIVVGKVVIPDGADIVVRWPPRRRYVILNDDVNAKVYLGHACVREECKRGYKYRHKRRPS
jgi:hypothetical protein